MAKKLPFLFKITIGAETNEVSVEVDVPGVIKVGKLDSSHLRIDHESVSRMHAVIEVNELDDIHIIDLGSAKGTSVDGQRVSKTALADGALVQLGDAHVAVSIGEPVGAGATEGKGAPASDAVQPAGQGAIPAPAAVMAPGMLPGMVAPAGSAPAGGAAVAAPAASDPEFDLQDGTRAIEVTSLFENTVINVRHLDGASTGKVKPSTLR